MSLPQTNFRPPFNITRASHLVLTSRDLAKARDFYTEVIGLKVSDETATTIFLRGVEERAHLPQLALSRDPQSIHRPEPDAPSRVPRLRRGP